MEIITTKMFTVKRKGSSFSHGIWVNEEVDEQFLLTLKCSMRIGCTRRPNLAVFFLILPSNIKNPLAPVYCIEDIRYHVTRYYEDPKDQEFYRVFNITPGSW